MSWVDGASRVASLLAGAALSGACWSGKLSGTTGAEAATWLTWLTWLIGATVVNGALTAGALNPLIGEAKSSRTTELEPLIGAAEATSSLTTEFDPLKLSNDVKPPLAWIGLYWICWY